ncbi:MAG: OadG family protein [Clostridia bacterium]|nr:OadG family protein [Clostridia bacterium]
MKTGVKLFAETETAVAVNTQEAAAQEQAALANTNTETVAADAKPGVADIANVFVRGLGTVFVGLVALIVIIKIMGALCVKFIKEAPKAAPAAKKAAPAPAANDAIANRGEFIAAVSAAIATVMGKDVGAIRIVSVKKVD